MPGQSTKTDAVEAVPLPALNWQTILYNCECHTFEDVVQQLMIAIGCSHLKGSHLAQIVHNFGSATVFKGTREKCEGVADVLGRIGLLVKVVQ